MASGKEGAGYWLPPEFLSDDDFLIDTKNFSNSNTHNYHVLEPDFCFPAEFPFDFHTQKDHLLQKLCAMSTSPQSTLSGLRSGGGSHNGSRNAAQSPPSALMSPRYDAVEDLIYLAAGEVAKLRLNRGRAMNSCPQPRNLPQFHKDTKISHTQPEFGKIGSRAVRGMSHVAWDPYQNHSHGRAAPDGGGAAARKACAGTGVFLPRRYDSNSHSSYPRTSPGCSAPSFQGRSSPQIHTKPLMYRFLESQPQPKLGRAFVPDHNSILARRNALFLLQQRRSFSPPMVESRDHPRLPQEWSY